MDISVIGGVIRARTDAERIAELEERVAQLEARFTQPGQGQMVGQWASAPQGTAVAGFTAPRMVVKWAGGSINAWDAPPGHATDPDTPDPSCLVTDEQPEMLAGLKVIVDPAMPEGVVEFRSRLETKRIVINDPNRPKR
jgi:hypothetical protein